jgi:hypothetical protein
LNQVRRVAVDKSKRSNDRSAVPYLFEEALRLENSHSSSTFHWGWERSLGKVTIHCDGKAADSDSDDEDKFIGDALPCL